MEIGFNITVIIFAFIALAWSSDKFVLGASNIAKIFGVSPLIIGITIVGFGTSAPEILVSIMASLQGNPDLAIGNAVGSNITNIALVLGVTAVLIPITVRKSILIREMNVLFIIMIATFFLISDSMLETLDGIILLGGQVIILILMTHQSRKEYRANKNSSLTDNDLEVQPTTSKSGAIFWLILGLIVLLASSKILVWGAINIAEIFGVSDLIIGLTIVALGTSLPELAACIAAVRHKHSDIAIGNILGSNIFNILSVIGIAGVIKPTHIDQNVLYRDYPIMLGLTLILLLFSFSRNKTGVITKSNGIIFLVIYCSYQFLLFYS